MGLLSLAKTLFIGAMAAGLLYFGGTMAMDTYEMSQMEPVPAAEVAEHSGVVTVEGEAASVSGATVETEYRGVEALAYVCEVRDYKESTDMTNDYATLESETDAVDFAVRDRSGRIRLHLGGDPSSEHGVVRGSSDLHLDMEGVRTEGEKSYFEGSISEDDRVFVRGDALESGGVGGDIEIWEGGKSEATTDSYFTSGVLLFIGGIVALGFLSRIKP